MENWVKMEKGHGGGGLFLKIVSCHGPFLSLNGFPPLRSPYILSLYREGQREDSTQA